jgi:XapX domain-containing protein
MPYVYSLISGLLFGIGYGLLGLKSPAPPMIALVGLLGMLGGDNLISYLKAHLAAHDPPAVSAPATPGAAAPGPAAPQPAAPEQRKPANGAAPTNHES